MPMEKQTRWGALAVALLVLLASTVGFIQINEIETEQKRTLAQQELTMLSDLTSHWVNEQKTQIEVWAQLLEALPTLDQEHLVALLDKNALYTYYLLDSNGYVQHAQDEQWLGQVHPIVYQQVLFQKVLQGDTQWLLPYRYKPPTRDLSGNVKSDLEQLLIAVPLKHNAKIKGVLIATISFQPQLYPIYRNLLPANTAFFSVSHQQQGIISIGQRNPEKRNQIQAEIQNKSLELDFYLSYQPYIFMDSLQLHHWLLLFTGGLSLTSICLLFLSFQSKGSQKLPAHQLGKLMFEHSGEGLILLNHNGDAVSFNALAQQLLAGENEIGLAELTTLLLELSLRLKTDSGDDAPNFTSLIQQADSGTYFGLWGQGESQKLLSCHFNKLETQRQVTLVQIKDVSVSRTELIQLKRQSDTLEQAAELVFWVKEDGGIIYANQTSLQILGYSKTDMLNLRLKDIDAAINEDSWHLLWSRVRRGETVQHEASLLKRSGMSFPADTHMSFYQDSYDAFICVFARDISLRKRLEVDLYRNRAQLADKLSVTSQELQVREAENEALLEALPDLLLVFNARFELLHYQQPKGDPLKISLRNGINLFDLFSVLSEEELRITLLEPKQSAQARYFAEVTRASANNLQILELRFARASDNRIIVMVRDISTRKKEEFIRQFNNSLLTHISTLQTRFICAKEKKPDLTSQLNNLMHLAQANFGFYALTEPLQQKIGEGAICEQINANETALTTECRLKLREWGQQCVTKWLHHERPLNPELVLVDDILPGYCSSSSDPLQKSGLLILPVLSGVDLQMGFFILVNDTRSWSAEVSLFEPWIATCAAILAGYENDQERLWAEFGLKQEKERAEQANQAKTQFLSRMSHEFRTPLNAILGFGQLIMLESEDLSEDHYEQVEQIVTSGQEMLALVDEILDLAKLERNEFKLMLEPIDISQVLKQVVTEHTPQLTRDQLQLNLEIPDQVIIVQADQARLKQMINCLLHNAIKFNQPNGSVSVSLLSTAEHCIFKVQDTGLGIEESFLSQLFSPFESAEGSVHAQGIGIGLALSKHIVEAMGGSIEAESKLGVGSCFTVRLPLYSQVKNTQPSNIMQPNHSSNSVDSQRFELLYIEDEISNQQLLERFFAREEHQKAGFVLTIASTVEEGLEAFLNRCPDLIIMDMNLSGISGAELLAVIRAQPMGDELPIIALSGQVEPEYIDEALEQGFDDYLCKPLDFQLLMSVIQRYRS